ncbi:MAG: hypothetical protein GY850_14095 [bacterium]|nr:hypothetical protein [bacterium]
MIKEKLLLSLFIITTLLIFPGTSAGTPLKKLIKISISSEQKIAKLKNMGLNILVAEKNYVVAIGGEKILALLTQVGFSVGSLNERDLVRSLIKITYKTKADLDKLPSDLGLDIWEVQPDHIIAQAYSGQINVLTNLGFSVEVIFENIQESTMGVYAADAEDEAGQYHSYSEVLAALQALENTHPAICKVVDIGDSVEGRDIWAIKISDNVTQDEDEPKVLFLGCHHAREWIAVDVPLLLAERMVQQYATDGQVQDLVDHGEIWIVPMVNPDGHEYSRTVYRQWRKNRRDNLDGSYGVDLNRNYDYMWGGSGSSGTPAHSTYRGPSAFSEPETRAVRDLLLNIPFKSIITYHSYGQFILHSWGYTNSPTPDHIYLSTMGQAMSDLMLGVNSMDYDPMQSASYGITSGDTTDWTYGTFGIPSFSIELRPKTYSQGGFVLPEDQILPTFEENWPTFTYLIAWTQTDDFDEDGVSELTDNCPQKPNGPDWGTCSPGSCNAGILCIDDAGCGGACSGASFCSMNQEDGDFDGFGDVCDNCPADCNADQLDADGDIAGDVCDASPGCGGCSQPACENECITDSDNDGIPDPDDNCPDNCNVNQLDADGDQTGDVCDPAPGCGGCGQSTCEQEC